MELTFTKGGGKVDQLQIRRRDGTVETIDCPKQGIIPHDMVHYAVEHTLQRAGFLGRVHAGEAASFRMQAETESDSVERLVEVIQGDAWSGAGSSADEVLDMFRLTCSARGSVPLPLTTVEIEAVRTAMEALGARWSGLAVGQSLRLTM